MKMVKELQLLLSFKPDSQLYVAYFSETYDSS